MSNLFSRGLSDRKEPTFRGWMLISLLCHNFNTDFHEFACQAYWIIIPITIQDGLAWNLKQTFTVSREPTYTVDPQHHPEADICGFEGTVSLTTEWTALESCSDFHCQQRIVISFSEVARVQSSGHSFIPKYLRGRTFPWALAVPRVTRLTEFFKHTLTYIHTRHAHILSTEHYLSD